MCSHVKGIESLGFQLVIIIINFRISCGCYNAAHQYMPAIRSCNYPKAHIILSKFAGTAHLPPFPHLRLQTRLMSLLRQQRGLVEILIRRRHIQRWVPIEEVHRLECYMNNLTRHDREVLNACSMLQAELDEEYKISILDILLAACP